MNANEYNKHLGSLRISKDVIATIAKISALEVEGVTGFVPAVVDLKNMISKKTSMKPVTVTLVDDIADLDLYITIKHTATIPVVAKKVQVAVKEAVQSMTGITVAKVNIIISGIAFDN